jgi:hypothetical protein
MNKNSTLLNTVLSLSKLNEKFKNSRLRIVSSNRVYLSKFNFFKYICSSEQFRETPYADILLNYFHKSEKIYPGSSYLLSCYIVNLILKNKSIFENEKNVEKSLDNITKYFNQLTVKKNSDLIKNILEFSGPNATIICNPTNSSEVLVKKRKNPIFNVSIHKDFSNIYFSKSKSKTQSYLISVLDVFIERESELIPLIDKAKDNNLPLIIFCRGMTDNCVKAIKNIILRNKVHILPYIVKFDNEDPFKLEDLSKVLNCQLVSAELGDSMYKNSVEKSSIGMLKAQWHNIEIFNPNNEINEIINEKLKDCNDSSLKKYLFKRKARINTNIVEILIPMSNIEMLSEVKYLIVCYNNIAIFGLKEIDNYLYSYKCIESVKILGNKLAETLSSIGYIILQNKEDSNELC